VRRIILRTNAYARGRWGPLWGWRYSSGRLEFICAEAINWNNDTGRIIVWRRCGCTNSKHPLNWSLWRRSVFITDSVFECWRLVFFATAAGAAVELVRRHETRHGWWVIW